MNKKFEVLDDGLFINKISKSYGNKKVVRDINITIKRREIVGLLGPNGAGKTTTFYIIVGLVKPETGSIILDKIDVSNLPIYLRGKLGISYLPQESSIFRGMNVEENILSILEKTEKSTEAKQKKLEDLLAEFGIEHLRYAPSLSLSGGERRRLEIARCLASNPNFILLDEPLAGIDPIAIQDVKKLIQNLKNRNIGVLMTDHNVKSTLEIVDRAYIIFEGKVLFKGRPDEIIKNKNVRTFYLGNDF